MKNHMHCVLGETVDVTFNFLPLGDTTKAKTYCETLNKLQRAIQNKRCGLLSNEIGLLQENAQGSSNFQDFIWYPVTTT